MRILGFSERWPKLMEPVFSTFRYTRKDKDWQIGEEVQIYFHPRGKDREFLGIAQITNKERRNIDPAHFQPSPLEFTLAVSDKEAITDGFKDREDMSKWFRKTYGKGASPVMNRLTLIWKAQTPIRK